MLRTFVAIILLSAAMSAVGTAGEPLRPGDIVVSDIGAKKLVRIDPTTGSQTVITSGGWLTQPFGLAIDPAGQVFVADLGGTEGAASDGFILKVDPATGAQTLFCTNLQDPIDVALDSDQSLLVSDSGARSVYRITQSGRTLLSEGNYHYSAT